MGSMQTYEVAAAEHIFDTFLRNVRIQIDGTVATMDLIPSLVLDRSTDEMLQDKDPNINKLIARSKPIVEAKRFLRVHFDCIHAVVIQEEFVDSVAVVEAELDSAPRIKPDSPAPYPFLRVINSEWKRFIPDYQGGESPDLDHFKILSMETCADVLGCVENTEWLENE